MLIAEYDYDTDIQVQREEERQIAFAEGEAQGFSDGARKKALEDAQNFKRLGVSVDIITQATGLSKQEVNTL